MRSGKYPGDDNNGGDDYSCYRCQQGSSSTQRSPWPPFPGAVGVTGPLSGLGTFGDNGFQEGYSFILLPGCFPTVTLMTGLEKFYPHFHSPR